MPTTMPLIEDATRREFIALLGAAGLLTACGNDDDGGGGGAETRSVTHELGTTEVPIRAERIVTADYDTTATVVALGARPIGAPDLDLVEISEEQLGLLEPADLVVVVEYGGLAPRLAANPLWGRLPAVQAGRVLEIESGDYGSAEGGPLASRFFIDEILPRLLDTAA